MARRFSGMAPGICQLSKLLAEWFWIERWDGSSAVTLPMEAIGIYRSMLSQAWRRGASLPLDETEIQLIIRVRPEEWERSWPKVKPYWQEQGGRLVNETQVEVYKDALSRHERAQARAQAGAQASAQARRKQEHKQSPPSPSPSPSKHTTYGEEEPMKQPPLPVWLTAAIGTWRHYFKGENLSIFQWLNPLVKEFGEDIILGAWDRYCVYEAGREDGKYAAPAAFARKPGPWMQKAPEKVKYMTKAQLLASQL